MIQFESNPFDNPNSNLLQVFNQPDPSASQFHSYYLTYAGFNFIVNIKCQIQLGPWTYCSCGPFQPTQKLGKETAAEISHSIFQRS
jgi:hypothetical protein